MTEHTKRQLRGAEAVALATTVVALLITRLLITTGQAQEGNPLTALAIHGWGWSAAAGVAILTTTGAFLVLQRTPDNVALAGGLGLAGASTLNAANDLYVLSQTGIPDTFYVSQYIEFAIPVLLAATVLFARPEIHQAASLVPKLNSRGTRAIVLSALLVVSIVPASAVADTTTSDSESVGTMSVAAGDEKWNNSNYGPTQRGGYTVYNNSLYGAAYTGTDWGVVALNEADGTHEWSTDLGGGAQGLTIAEGTIFVGNGTGVVALDPADGSVLWHHQMANEVFHNPTYSNGTLYAADNNGNLISLDIETQTENWNRSLGRADSSPVVGDGRVYFGNATHLGAFDVDTGDQVWKNDQHRQDGQMVYADGVVVTQANNGTERQSGVDATDGTVLWSYEHGQQARAAPTIENGVAYIAPDGSQEPRVLSVDLQTGAKNWEWNTSSYTTGEGDITYSNGNVYVGTGDGGSDSGAVYAINADDGSQKWVNHRGNDVTNAMVVHDGVLYSGTGSVSFALHTDHGKSSSGERVRYGLRSQVGDMAVTPSDTVSGQVVDQNGDPVPENTTVEVWGVAEPALNTSDAESLEQQADDLLEELENPLPDDWNENYDLEDHQSGQYLLVHEASDWNREYDIQAAPVREQIDSPELEPSDNEPVILSVWDATDSELVGNPVINSFPGTPEQTDVVVEQLSPSGEVTDSSTYESEVIATTGNSLNEQEHHGVRTQLPQGIYRAYPEGSPEQGYVFVVGGADAISNQIEQDLRDRRDSLTNRADRIRSMVGNDEVIRRQTTTDANGEFSVSVPQNVVTVQMQAYRADGQRLQNVQNASMDDLRDAAEGDYNGTFILPSPEPDRANPPAENVTVRTIRSPQVPNVGMDSYADLLEWFRNQRLNDTIADLEAEYAERLENQTRAQVEALYNDSRALIEGYPPAREQFLDSTRYDEVPPPDELTTDELRSATREMQSALYQADRLQMEEPELDVNVDVDAPDTSEQVSEISGSFPVPDNVDEENVAVQLIWSNGSVQQMPEEYWSISPDGLTTDRTVEVEAFPMSTSDAAVANIRVRASSEDGVAEETARVVNPQFDGNVPDVQAIDLNTLRPGVNERVTFSVRAEDGTGYGSIQAVDVFAPDGTNLPTTINASTDRVRFDPASQGTHFVRVEYTNQGGTTFVETFQVRAEESSSSNPPTMRVSNGPSGTHALVGEGFRSAQVEEDGNTLRLGGVIPGDANSPGQIVVEPQSAMQSSTDELEIRVLRGDDRETVRSHIAVELHVETFEDDVLLWRGDDPITHDGETQYGEVEQRDDNKHVIHTVTNSEGVASIEMVRDPSIVQRTEHWMVVNTPVPRSPLMILDMAITYLINLIPTLGDLTTSTTAPAAGEADATKTAHPMGVTA